MRECKGCYIWRLMVYETALYVSKGRGLEYSMDIALSFGSEGRGAVWVWHDGDGWMTFIVRNVFQRNFCRSAAVVGCFGCGISGAEQGPATLTSETRRRRRTRNRKY